MSLGGLKKQINKANQYVSEKIGGAKGTELDDEFTDMEKKTDAMCRLVDELMARTQEVLQPNPASRAKMSAVKSISRFRGQTNHHALYPQPEGQLGDCMIKHGRELADTSVYGRALVEVGESYKQLAEIKYSFEDTVKQNFLEPLQSLQNKELKEVNFHRKKVHSRRLDYDGKKRKQGAGGAGTEEEIQAAEEKFNESKLLAEAAMHNLLESDTDQILQLSAFVDAEVDYHRQSVDVLQMLLESLKERCEEASSKPHSVQSSKESSVTSAGLSSSTQSSAAASGAGMENGRQPCVEALYDFEAENDKELTFKEGDIIKLISQIDENWYEGTFRSRTGYFPISYVKVLVALPTP